MRPKDKEDKNRFILTGLDGESYAIKVSPILVTGCRTVTAFYQSEDIVTDAKYGLIMPVIVQTYGYGRKRQIRKLENKLGLYSIKGNSHEPKFD